MLTPSQFVATYSDFHLKETAAYGWPEPLTAADILEKLLAENLARAEAQK